MRSTTRLALAAFALAITATPLLGQRVTLQTGRRAWLGLSYQTVIQRTDDAMRQTIVIRDIVAESPAKRAGLQVGDTILRINDINATDQLLSSLGVSLSPGDSVQLMVRRDGRDRSLTIQAATAPTSYYGMAPRDGEFRGIVTVHPDSLRGRMRILMDSAFVHLDSIGAPNLYIDRGRIRVFPDSIDDVHIFPFDARINQLDSLSRRFRYHIDTTWVSGGDTIRWRSFTTPRVFEFHGDSILLRADSLMNGVLRPRTFAFSVDSMFNLSSESMRFRELDATPFAGITLWGARAVAGAELTELNTDLGTYFGVHDGILVVRVHDRTPAADAGLMAGDVIVSAAGEAVGSIGDLRRTIARASAREPVTLDVIRRGDRVQIRMDP